MTRMYLFIVVGALFFVLVSCKQPSASDIAVDVVSKLYPYTSPVLAGST